MIQLRSLILASCGLLESCATGSYAVIDGIRNGYADPTIASVYIVDIDGELMLDGRTELRVTPGFHYIHVASSRLGSRALTESLPFAFKAQPCMRYSVVAKHHSPFDPTLWEIIASQEPILSCKVDNEG